MIRAVVISLLVAGPAAAATLHPVRISECVAVSVKAEACGGEVSDHVARVHLCRWPGPPDLPPPDFAGLDPIALKDVSPFAEGGAHGESAQISAPEHELAVPGVLLNPKSGPALWMDAGRPMRGGGVIRVGSPFPSFFADAPGPAPDAAPDVTTVPLPAGAVLLLSALALLARVVPFRSPAPLTTTPVPAPARGRRHVGPVLARSGAVFPDPHPSAGSRVFHDRRRDR